MSLDQPSVGRERVRVAGGSPEPAVSSEQILAALGPDVEPFRALLPVGYEAGVAAYRTATAELTPRDLAQHYTHGLAYFHDQFVPHLKQTLMHLSGGVWQLDDFHAYAAGSDVDFMTHLVEGVAARSPVALFPGDWYGFQVGVTQQSNIFWDASAQASLACLCIPSVRNGHLTEEMVDFLGRSESCLLNLNLFPTLAAAQRRHVAQQLSPLLDRAILSISFSRGFGLTASQLGVALVSRNHPLRRRFHKQWQWLTYFYNSIAARAFMLIDLPELCRVDDLRRQWVREWLDSHGLPAIDSGSYYVKSFRVEQPAVTLQPLLRDGIVRVCLKPAIY